MCTITHHEKQAAKLLNMRAPGRGGSDIQHSSLKLNKSLQTRADFTLSSETVLAFAANASV